MSSAQTYRTLLRLVARLIPAEGRTPYRRFVQDSFRTAQADPQALRVAEEYATHLVRLEEHASTLSRYNIAVDRDGNNMEHVRSTAARCGLSVPY